MTSIIKYSPQINKINTYYQTQKPNKININKIQSHDIVCFKGTKIESTQKQTLLNRIKNIINKICYFPAFINDNYIGKPAKIYWEKVDDKLYRCSKPTREIMQQLQQNGVKVIIDLKNSNKKNKTEEMNLAKEFGIKYVNIPQTAIFPPTKKELETIFSYLQEGPVAIHCKNGRDRTGTLVGIYRKEKYGWDYEKAEKEMEKYGFKPNKFPLLNNYLKNYNEKLNIPELRQA